MPVTADCFQVQAPCFSENGVDCATVQHVSALSHAVVSVTYLCDDPDVEITVEFEIRADGTFTTDEDFPATSAESDAVLLQPGDMPLPSANIQGLLRAGIHVDLIAHVLVDGSRLDGASNVHGNIEIVE